MIRYNCKRNSFVLIQQIGATRLKLERTEMAISDLEGKRIKLLKRVRRSRNYFSKFAHDIEYIDNCLRARHTYLGKYKRILCNLHLELEGRIR